MPVKKRSTNNENGFALLFAMLALLLMASIGLAMVYAADTETSIDSNYKDQTRATYAAYSALEEAKDRLRQGCGTSTTCTAIHWPTNIPKPTGSGTGYTNIIYIINPKTGETVKPWDPNNAYYDWEICDTTNENFPNSFCSTGMPSSASAYTIYCNGTSTACSASAGSNYNLLTSTVNAPWQRSVPLDYKWIRINLKTETMLYNAATSTGYPVGASTSSNTVVCWDGHGELAPGSGYNTDCTPNTALGVTLAAPGGGWTGVPTVTLGAPDVGGGTQATVTVNTTTTPNVLSSATVVTNGTGYTSNPTVTLVDPGTAPTTAGVITAHAVPVGAALTSLAVATGGVGTNTAPCFAGSSTPTVSITGGGGSGASATATMSGLTCLASVSVAGSCSGANFKSVTITGIPVSGGTGSGGVMSLTFNASDTVVGAAITTGGSGYTSNSGLGIATGSGSPNAMTNGCANNLSASFTVGQRLSSLTIGAGGAGYTGTPANASSTCTSGCPSVSFNPPASNGGTPTASFVVGTPVANAGQIDYLTIVSQGSGYSAAPLLVFSGGGGTGATGTATISNNPYSVTSITVSGGSGYTTTPTCTISGGGLAAAQDCTTGAANGMRLNLSAGQSTYYGQVAEVTAFAQTSNFGNRAGAQFTTQMELATSVRLPAKFNIGGAITLAGPTIVYDPPNSDPYVVNGTDAGNCGTGAAKPAIGVIDDPSNPQGLVASVVADIPSGRTGNYTGSGASPDVENAFSALGGSPTPSSLDALLQVLKAETQPANLYTSPVGGPLTTYSSLNNLNPTGSPPINFVDGNLSLSGNFTGSGVLVVTGTLTLQGDYHWNGLVLVIGQGVADLQGGGNGTITGSLYVAKIYDTDGSLLSAMGTSQLSNSGGGGNGVQYNSCFADSYLTQLPKIAADPSTLPGKVMSVRTVTRH